MGNKTLPPTTEELQAQIIRLAIDVETIQNQLDKVIEIFDKIVAVEQQYAKAGIDSE